MKKPEIYELLGYDDAESLIYKLENEGFEYFLENYCDEDELEEHYPDFAEKIRTCKELNKEILEEFYSSVERDYDNEP